MASTARVEFEEDFQALLNYIERSGRGVDISEVRGKMERVHKKVTQLIAGSWLSNTPEEVEIEQALQGKDSDTIKSVFKKYGADLDCFGSVNVEINENNSSGSFQERSEQIPTLTLPYPPRPESVMDSQLRTWTNNDDPATIHPPAYIPACTV
ncbi:MAG: hypothetical protein J7647_09170 [Cyanobacteria bacterium SBLK]|nr:hypothetical protein [Cyanobacteria bacterium SBLK]